MKKVPLNMALNEFMRQNLGGMPFKNCSPLYQAARKLTGKRTFTKYQKIVAGNGRRQREAILDYVQKRKRGENKSAVEGEADLLTLFLQNSDVFSDQLIVDELRDFFIAAVMTT